MEQIKSTECTTALVLDEHVYDPLIFSPDLIKFTRNEYNFLNAYRLGVPLDDAALKANLSPDYCRNFLKRDRTRSWLEDRALKDHIKTEWSEPGKWWAMGDAVLEGKKALSKSQTVVFQEFGARVCPKPREYNASPQNQTVNFNFTPESVQAAFKRQASIDAEVSEVKDAL